MTTVTLDTIATILIKVFNLSQRTIKCAEAKISMRGNARSVGNSNVVVKLVLDIIILFFHAASGHVASRI